MKMATRTLKPGLYFGNCARSLISEESLAANMKSTKREKDGAACGKDSSTRSRRNRSPRSVSKKTGRATVADQTGHGSIPIAIEAPKKTTRTYTPLTARRELAGGYFPNHEQIERRPHHIRGLTEKPKISHRYSPADSANMSAASSTATSPMFTPQMQPYQDPLMIPKGKYHPSNYTPAVHSHHARFLSSKTLSIPASARRNQVRESHPDASKSDGSKKLHQYQRAMVAQTQHVFQSGATGRKPAGVTLRPIHTSSDAITPLELENEKSGYIAAGERKRHDR